MCEKLMPKLPYYKMYPADFDADENARRLNDTEAGFFLRCLNHGWNNNGSIPANLKELAECLSKRVTYVQMIWKKVGKCFVPHPEDDSRLVNPRQWKEYIAATAKSAANSEAGKLGANAKRTLSERSANAFPRAYEYESVSKSSQEVTAEEQQTADASAPVPAAATQENVVSIPEREWRNFDFGSWFDIAWERWKKRRGNQRQLCQQHLAGVAVNARFLRDFELGLSRWCDYWEVRGWNFCTQTLMDWVRDEGWKSNPPNTEKTQQMTKKPGGYVTSEEWERLHGPRGEETA